VHTPEVDPRRKPRSTSRGAISASLEGRCRKRRPSAFRPSTQARGSVRHFRKKAFDDRNADRGADRSPTGKPLRLVLESQITLRVGGVEKFGRRLRRIGRPAS
jgi:hypothetical protein